MIRKIEQYGPSSSFKVGNLAEGCVRCIKGEKIVLYATGSCSVGCSYCPIPDDRQNIDDTFVNEVPIQNPETIFAESDVCRATGAGITGGDPMEVPERTIKFIEDLRSKYGKTYHLHLYTSGQFFIDNEELIDKLFRAGLDELRFHPRNLKSKKVWEIVARTKIRYPDKSIGFEIPAIPNREEDLTEIIEFADKNNLDFVNMNEYEFTESNFNKLSQKGFISVLTNSAAVGSKETALKVVNQVKDRTDIKIHFCSSGSKDSIQLVQRFIRRANQIKREFDHVNEEGLLEYGRMTVISEEEFKILLQLLDDFEVDDDLKEIFKEELAIETADYILASIVTELREYIPQLQAEIISRHPVENGPIITVDPL